MNFNEFLNESSKPMGLSVDKTKKVAELYAKALSKADGSKCTVNTRTLEEDSFDIDCDGEEFDGGSYTIHANGDVVNDAVPGSPVYGKWNDSVDTIVKNLNKLSESFLNEGVEYAVMLIGGSVGDTPRPRDAKGYVGTASTTEELYTKEKAKEKADRMNKNILTPGEKKHYGLKYIVVPVKDGKFIKESVTNEANLVLGLSTNNYPAGTIGRYRIESTVINLRKVANLSKDSWSKYSRAFTDTEIGFEKSSDRKEALAAIQKSFDSGKNDIREFGINESVNERNITIKRQYTDKNPAVTVGKAAKVRNRMLEAIKDGKISQEEFDTILKEMTTDSKRWLRRNAQCFNVSEDGISLSKTGSRILKNVMIAEATTKAPKIWVPGGFDKEIAKYPNQKITRKIVLDAALKWDVNPEDAIKYVEFAWVIDLDENKNNNDMKTKFIYESFQEFVENKLNESKESDEASNILDDLLDERGGDMEELHGMSIEDAMDTVETYGHKGAKAKKIAEFLFGYCNESNLNEAFKSAKLANLFSVGSAGTKDLAGAFYNFSKLAIDKIEDYDIIEMDPQTARKEKRANAVYFYVVTDQKVNPYSETGTIPSTWNNGLIQSNTLLAITNGQNEWYSTAYSSYSKSETLKVASSRENAAGFDKRDSKRYDGSGITSITKVAELADIAYVIDLDVLKARYSTTSLQFKRAEDKRGAIAFQSDKDFKAANKARYNEILAQKASELPMDSLVLGAIDTLATQIKDALSKGEKGRYGELIVGLDPKGREIKMSDASNLMRNILDEYNRYVGYAVESEKEVATGYSGKFYEGRIKESAKTITDYVKKVDAKNYAW